MHILKKNNWAKYLEWKLQQMRLNDKVGNVTAFNTMHLLDPWPTIYPFSADPGQNASSYLDDIINDN